MAIFPRKASPKAKPPLPDPVPPEVPYLQCVGRRRIYVSKLPTGETVLEIKLLDRHVASLVLPPSEATRLSAKLKAMP